MRKKILFLRVIPIALVLLFFAGCQKNQTADRPQQQFTNIHLVPEQVARSVAEKFNPASFFQGMQVNAAYPTKADGNNKITASFTFKDDSGYPCLYIFNFENDGGFIFVSADYNLQPVLAFVERGEFKKDKVPATFIEWVNRTFENTEVVRKGLYDNSRTAHKAWSDYLAKNDIENAELPRIPPEPSCEETSTNVTVGPLLPVTWGQACSYNDLCPSRSCTDVCWSSPNAWTGCVATSTAQIVRYWQTPTSYSYNYASMPAGWGDFEVQRLMRDLGLSNNLNMDYACNGSGADAARVPTTLKTNFGFTSANRISYGTGTYDRVRNNLSYHWPVLLEGCRSRTNRFLGWIYTYDNCHEWVCDGYSATTITWCNEDGTGGGAGYLYFHMNWGWHETGGGNDFNGWFAFNNWNIPGLNWNYQYSQDAVCEIHP
jgi:hypothetical protein